MELPINLIPLSLFLAFLFTLLKEWKRSKAAQNKKLLPPSPWKLPIIGHLHHLAGAPPHHVLRKLSRKYGALMHLQMGEIPTVVVSSPRLVKEIMKTHDVAFANRPEMLVGRIISYNYSGIVFAPYGEHWRQMRKLCTMELLSVKRVRSFGSIRQDEASQLIASIKDRSTGSAPAPVNLTEKLAQYSSSVILKAAFGTVSKDEQHAFLELMIKGAMPGLSVVEISDLFPSLKILHRFFPIESEILEIHRNVGRVLDHIIDQHMENNTARSKGKTTGESGGEDLVDVLLRVKESGDLRLPITRNTIKATLIDMFVAGTETSSSTVEWAMAEMIRNPHVMSTAQSEVREAFRGKKTIEEPDIERLRFLKLVAKEALRLHPPGPLLAPRECREQCEIDGYVIPIGTRVLVNAWAIGRDPEYWDDPESFKPERFENHAVDFTGSHFEFIPFGAGRRICPGISCGLANVYLPLALLLYHFDWRLPNGLNPQDLDVTEKLGISGARSQDLLLFATPYDPVLDK